MHVGHTTGHSRRRAGKEPVAREAKEPCVLCGLDIEGRPYEIKTANTVLHFCCDGCEGIYRLLNDIEEGEDSTEPKPDKDTPGAAE